MRLFMKLTPEQIKPVKDAARNLDAAEQRLAELRTEFAQVDARVIEAREALDRALLALLREHGAGAAKSPAHVIHKPHLRPEHRDYPLQIQLAILYANWPTISFKECVDVLYPGVVMLQANPRMQSLYAAACRAKVLRQMGAGRYALDTDGFLLSTGKSWRDFVFIGEPVLPPK